MSLRLVCPCRQQKEDVEKDVQEFVIIGEFIFLATFVLANLSIFILHESFIRIEKTFG